MAEPILIWGAGAIGGTLGACWARAGLDVLLVDVAAEHVEACRTGGLTIEGPVEAFTQVVPAVTPGEVWGRYGRVVLAVKAHGTGEALGVLGPHVAADGCVLSAQNGLNEIAIAKALGPERTMGCFVDSGADWLGPAGSSTAIAARSSSARSTARSASAPARCTSFSACLSPRPC